MSSFLLSKPQTTPVATNGCCYPLARSIELPIFHAADATRKGFDGPRHIWRASRFGGLGDQDGYGDRMLPAPTVTISCNMRDVYARVVLAVRLWTGKCLLRLRAPYPLRFVWDNRSSFCRCIDCRVLWVVYRRRHQYPSTATQRCSALGELTWALSRSRLGLWRPICGIPVERLDRFSPNVADRKAHASDARAHIRRFRVAVSAFQRY